MSKNYIKLQNQGNILQNLMLLYEMKNSSGFSDENGYFTKRAIAEIAVNSMLVSSGGLVGEDIIDIVNDTVVNEERNSVLQNVKARMQLMRVLGLISTDYDSEIYAITDLGEKVLEQVFPDEIARIPSYKLLFEAFMGISSTSEVYEYNCDLDFNCYLGYEICYALASLDFKISTREMQIITTYSLEEIEEYITTVLAFRRKNQEIPETHEHFPKTQNGAPLRQASNLTRSINQILRQCDIIEKKQRREEGVNYYFCTDFGKTYTEAIKSNFHSLKFYTAQQFRKEKLIKQKEICNYGYLRMLSNAGYETECDNKKIVFSPYQLIPEANVSWLMESGIRKPPTLVQRQVYALNSQISSSVLRLKPTYLSDNEFANFIRNNISENNLISEILMAKESSDSYENLKKSLMSRYKHADKESFYPFVHALFRTMGLNCLGEIGRFDAYIDYNDDIVIPAEIKSFTETPSYNHKGIRQAVENKILTHKNDVDLSYASLVIGFETPSQLGDIQSLIDAVYSEFGIKIIAMDLETLVTMSINSIWNQQEIDFDTLFQSYGIIEA